MLYVVHHLLVNRLGTHETIRRQNGAFTEAMTTVKDYYSLCAKDAEELARYLQPCKWAYSFEANG